MSDLGDDVGDDVGDDAGGGTGDTDNPRRAVPDDRTDGLDTDEGVGGVTAGDFDLGGTEEAQDRRVEGGDPVTGDAVSRLPDEEPAQEIDPDVALHQAEPIRVSDRGPGGGAAPETPAPGQNPLRD